MSQGKLHAYPVKDLTSSSSACDAAEAASQAGSVKEHRQSVGMRDYFSKSGSTFLMWVSNVLWSTREGTTPCLETQNEAA